MYGPLHQLLGYTRPKESTNKHSSHQNAGFSIWVFENFPGVITLNPQSGRGRPPPATNTQSLTGRRRPGVATQTLVPLNFSAVVAPLALYCTLYGCSSIPHDGSVWRPLLRRVHRAPCTWRPTASTPHAGPSCSPTIRRHRLRYILTQLSHSTCVFVSLSHAEQSVICSYNSLELPTEEYIQYKYHSFTFATLPVRSGVRWRSIRDYVSSKQNIDSA